MSKTTTASTKTKVRKPAVKSEMETVQDVVMGFVAPMVDAFWRLSKSSIQNEQTRCDMVYTLYRELAKVLKPDQVNSWFNWVCSNSLGLTRQMATKMYAAHVLWRGEIHRDVEQLIEPCTLTEIAYKSVVHDGLVLGWRGKRDDLKVGNKWVKEFMRYVNTVGLQSPEYVSGRYLSLSTFRQDSYWADQEHAKNRLQQQVTITLSQIGMKDKRKETAASSMQILLVDKTGTMSHAAMQAEAAYRCKNSAKFEFIQLHK